MRFEPHGVSGLTAGTSDCFQVQALIRRGEATSSQVLSRLVSDRRPRRGDGPESTGVMRELRDERSERPGVLGERPADG